MSPTVASSNTSRKMLAWWKEWHLQLNLKIQQSYRKFQLWKHFSAYRLLYTSPT